jgi:acetyl esterase/lipase
VAGNSVGGNMAAVVALMAKNKGTPSIRNQLLFWPVTNANFENASYDEFDAGHFLTTGMMKWFWNNNQQMYYNARIFTPLHYWQHLNV